MSGSSRSRTLWLGVVTCGAVFGIAAVHRAPSGAIPLVVTTAPTYVTGPRVEVESQSTTTLSLKVVDVTDAEFVVDFSRADASDVWRATTTTPPGILFGNDRPRYAGAALRGTLGITPNQAITTLDPSVIVARPLDDVTVFRTFSGLAIGLWQQGAITEIHYAGTWVSDMRAIAQATAGTVTMCEAAVAECCNTTPGGQDAIWPPNLDGCNAALQCGSTHKSQACACLLAACQHCPHPPPSPPAVDPCPADEREISNQACFMGGPACEVVPPPPPPTSLEDIWDLLRQILDLLQEWLSQQVWN